MMGRKLPASWITIDQKLIWQLLSIGENPTYFIEQNYVSLAQEKGIFNDTSCPLVPLQQQSFKKIVVNQSINMIHQ